MAKSLFDDGCAGDETAAWADAQFADRPALHWVSTGLGAAMLYYGAHRAAKKGNNWWYLLSALGAANLLGNFGLVNPKTPPPVGVLRRTDKPATSAFAAKTFPGAKIPKVGT